MGRQMSRSTAAPQSPMAGSISPPATSSTASRTRSVLRVRDAVELVAGGEIDPAIGDCGAAVDLDICRPIRRRREEDGRERLAFLRARLEDVELAVHFAEVDLAVRQHRAGPRVAAIIVLPLLLAGLAVEAVEFADLVGDIEPALVNDRRRVAVRQPVLLPNQLRRLVRHLGGIDTDDAALGV